ncbi:hypothetical protein ACE3MQ_04675 [Paenibacillus lentus]
MDTTIDPLNYAQAGTTFEWYTESRPSCAAFDRFIQRPRAAAQPYLF